MKTDCIKCYCIKVRQTGNLICPLTTVRKDLENTFNYRVRGDEIIEVYIDKAFVCDNERKPHCKNCPFK